MKEEGSIPDQQVSFYDRELREIDAFLLFAASGMGKCTPDNRPPVISAAAPLARQQGSVGTVANLAAKLGIRHVLVPLRAGVLSALGLLLSPAAFDLKRTRKQPLHRLDPDAVSDETAIAGLNALFDAALERAELL